MRILHICAYTWEIGGPARTIYDLTLESTRLGHQVDILSPMSAGDQVYDTPEGVRVFTCLRTPFLSRIYREFSWDLWKFLKARAGNYDVIHIHGIWHFGSSAPFWATNQAAKVVTIHGLLDPWALNHSKWKKKLVTLLFQKQLLRKANAIHVLNSSEGDDVKKYLGNSHPPIVEIPNGIPLAEYSHLPQKGQFRSLYSISSSKKLVLFMARLNIKKGLDLLLPAFKKYNDIHRETVLVLAGPDDGYRDQAESFIQQNRLSESVILTGLLTGETKKQALADADLFVLPSYSEGLSIAVLEAMASGIPALVSGYTGLDRLTRQYKAAEICELSVKSVSEGLAKTLGDDTHSSQLAENARKMIAENFNISAVVYRMIELYKKIQNRS